MEIPPVAPKPALSKAGIIVKVSEPVTRQRSPSIIHPPESYSRFLDKKKALAMLNTIIYSNIRTYTALIRMPVTSHQQVGPIPYTSLHDLIFKW